MEVPAVQYDIVAEQAPPYCCRASAPSELSCNSCKECINGSSTNSTPFVSAPSSPRKSTPFGYYLTTRASLSLSASSPAHDHIVEYDAVSAYTEPGSTSPSSPSLSEFEFSSRFSEADAWFYNPSSIAPPMSTAEELFHNGKIRPLNTRLCSSYCICFSDAILHDEDYHDPQFHDACHPYTDGPASAHAEHQQHQHLGHTNPTSSLSALEQWKKCMGRYDKGHAHGHHAERVMQIPSLPLARYRNSRREGGQHRRARSLSPLRVFHMDDKVMQARASFESEMHTNTKNSHAVDGGTIMRPRRSRKSWTLKELLNMGDNRVHDKRPQLQGNGRKSAKSRSRSAYTGRMEEVEVSQKNAKHNVGKRSLEEERWHSKSNTHNEGARSPPQAVEPEHGDQYDSIGSEEGQVEEMKKRNSIPYKKGLLGCLGFTSKLSTIKGLQTCMP